MEAGSGFQRIRGDFDIAIGKFDVAVLGDGEGHVVAVGDQTDVAIAADGGLFLALGAWTKVVSWEMYPPVQRRKERVPLFSSRKLRARTIW